MDIEMGKLRCDRNQLIKLVKAVVEIEPERVHVMARAHTLTLHASNDAVGYGESNAIDHILVRIPYLGPDYQAFVDSDKIVEAFKKVGKITTLPTGGKPLSFVDAPSPIKKEVKVQYDPEELVDVLKFLLAVDISSCGLLKYKGVVFNCGEMLTTCGHVIHVQENMPHLTEEPMLLGMYGAKSFYKAMKALESFCVRGVFKQRKSSLGTLYFEAEDESGIDVRLYSAPRTQTDRMGEVRDTLPITGDSITFVVHEPFIKEVAKHICKKDEEDAYLHLKTGTSLHYYSEGRSYKGELPMIRSMSNPTDVDLCISAKYLLEALNRSDATVQFIVPRPNSLSPIYVNCREGRFAIIAIVAPKEVDPE